MANLPEAYTAGDLGHLAHSAALGKLFNGATYVRANGGAVGDDSADDTSAFTTAYNTCPSGGVLVLEPNYTFRITSAITLAKPITIWGYGSHVRQSTTGAAGFTVTSSGVEIRGLTLQGARTPGSIVYNASERAINLTGTSAASPITSSIITDCEMYGWGRSGIEAIFVNNCRWQGNNIRDIGYAGIFTTCPQRGLIADNRVATIGPGTGGNAYGIAATRQHTSNITTDPRATDITISRNTITDVPIWEGIDTHGGERINIVDNTVRNCTYGIAMGTSSFGATVLAPVDCTAHNNKLHSTVTNGTAKGGIYLLGDTGVYATGKITHNLVVGYGEENDSGSGGIYMNYTSGVAVQLNRSVECSPAAIQCSHDNKGVNIVGNTSQDNWTTAGNANGVCFATASGSNSGYVDANTMVRGSKSAGSVNSATVFVASGNAGVTQGTNPAGYT